jgi:virulence factor Mce-like protein
VSRLDEVTRQHRHGGRPRWRPHDAVIGLLLLIVAIVGPYIAFTKHVPFTSRGYELSAVFRNAANVAPNSPVRIAGVNVGKVVGVSRDHNDAKVTFTVDDEGRPVRSDALIAIRPRLFLEGNFFLDLKPGSPANPELASGSTIPVSQTSTAVQLDQILTSLQEPTRRNLQRLVASYGTALTHIPTAAQNRTQDPLVHGLSAAAALNQAFDYGGKAGRSSAEVSRALLGTEPGDLSRLVIGAGRFFQAFGGRERDLEGLVANFSTTVGALAAESQNLGETVHQLAPTLRTARTSLATIDRTLPALRTFAIELRPAVAELPATIRASGPWLDQVRPLLGEDELAGDAALLRRSTPDLAGAGYAAKRSTLPQLSRLARCTSRVLVPTSKERIADRFATREPNFKEFFYATVNLAGESQDFDGNGPFLRLQPGGGSHLVSAKDKGGNLPTDKVLWGHTVAAPLGTQPQLGTRPPKRPGVACFTQNVPNLNGPLGVPGGPSPRLASAP